MGKQSGTHYGSCRTAAECSLPRVSASTREWSSASTAATTTSWSIRSRPNSSPTFAPRARTTRSCSHRPSRSRSNTPWSSSPTTSWSKLRPSRFGSASATCSPTSAREQAERRPSAAGPLMDRVLSRNDASRFARLALANIEREYPSKLDHVLASAADVASPRQLHPAFFGSFDWHSCVHAHWLLARVLKLYPRLPQQDAIRAALDAHLAGHNIDGEIAYLQRPESRSFERTYGWAWLLKFAAELAGWDDADGRRWTRELAPLARVFVERFLSYLPIATYPLRHGVHSNSAFALAFAVDYARDCGAPGLAELCESKARQWYFE